MVARAAALRININTDGCPLPTKKRWRTSSKLCAPQILTPLVPPCLSTIFRSWVFPCATTGCRLLFSFLFLCSFFDLSACVCSCEVTVTSRSHPLFVSHRSLLILLGSSNQIPVPYEPSCSCAPYFHRCLSLHLSVDLVQGVALSTTAFMPFRFFAQTPLFSVSFEP